MYIVYGSEYNANVRKEQTVLLEWVAEAVRLNPTVPLSDILAAAAEYVANQTYTIPTRMPAVADPVAAVVEPVEELEAVEPVVEPESTETALEANVEAVESIVEDTLLPAPVMVSDAELTETVVEEYSIVDDVEVEDNEVFLPSITEEDTTDEVSIDDLIAAEENPNSEDVAVTSFEFSEPNYEAYSETVEEDTVAAPVVEAEVQLPPTSINDAVDFSNRKRRRGGGLLTGGDINDVNEPAAEDTVEGESVPRSFAAGRRGAVSGVIDDKHNRVQENIAIIFRDPNAIANL